MTPTSSCRQLRDPREMQALSQVWRQEGRRIALVPTMGALHAGHLALVTAAREHAEEVVVSIFVNPLQFGKHEDFEKYPRDLDQDDRLLAGRVSAIFVPTPGEFYPDGFRTRVRVEGLGDYLCGKSRPGHFEGVATVCLKLFEVVRPDVALFGYKDYQQFRILKQLCDDLLLPIQLLGHPTVREADGLALSSRNRYLTPPERERAGQIPQAVARALSGITLATRVEDFLQRLTQDFRRADLGIDYVAVASELDLVPVDGGRSFASVAKPRLFLAVRCGTTRLIDNYEVRPK